MPYQFVLDLGSQRLDRLNDALQRILNPITITITSTSSTPLGIKSPSWGVLPVATCK